MIFCCGALPFLRCGLRVGCWAVDAEVRIGQLFKALPKADKGNQYTGKMVSITGDTNQKTKKATIANLGFDKNQAVRFETLAEHPERLMLARRNLTPDQRQILIGRRYNREKLLHGGDRKSKGNICTLKPTAEKLADEYKVSPRTIKNHAETARQFERLQVEKPALAKERI